MSNVKTLGCSLMLALAAITGGAVVLPNTAPQAQAANGPPRIDTRQSVGYPWVVVYGFNGGTYMAAACRTHQQALAVAHELFKAGFVDERGRGIEFQVLPNTRNR